MLVKGLVIWNPLTRYKKGDRRYVKHYEDGRWLLIKDIT
jgi:hypothetical protein